MVYLTDAAAGVRMITSGFAAADLAAAETDIDSVINTYLGITANTTDAQTLAVILPIAKRMLRMELAMRKSEQNVDATASIALSGQLAALGIADPIQLTRKEMAMLDDVWQDSKVDEGKSNVVSVYNTRTGRRVY